MFKGFSRSFRYSLYRGSQFALIALGGTLVYSIYMAVLNETFTIESILTTYPVQLGFLTAFISMINGLVNAVIVVPEQISFGCLRKHAAMAYGCGYLVTMVEILLVLSVYYGGMLLLAPGSITIMECITNLILFVCFMLAVSGLTGVMAVVVMKYGRVAYLAFVICLSMCVGGFTGFMLTDKASSINLNGQQLLFLMAAFSIVMFGLGNAVLIWYSGKIEVKA